MYVHTPTQGSPTKDAGRDDDLLLLDLGDPIVSSGASPSDNNARPGQNASLLDNDLMSLGTTEKHNVHE